MPYTPPAQHSPESSKVSSPLLSRSSSYGPTSPLVAAGSSPRPGQLPRSASYLTKHRRTPSVVKAVSHTQDVAAESHDRIAHDHVAFRPNPSLRQSPPPVIDTSLMPVGAVISPPDSGGNSSEDEDVANDRKGRMLENLDELKEAIRVIGQRREASPDRIQQFADFELAVNTSLPSDIAEDKQTTASVASPEPAPFPPVAAERSNALTEAARKVSHSRSSTEASFLLDVKPVDSTAASSDDEDDALVLAKRVPMVRKKSGELVKPALKPGASRARPSSMPSTPTYPKNVHFDSHLEHVRHFLQVDKPLAVSAGSSPVETYDSESEFPLEIPRRPSTPPFEWEILLPNFPSEHAPRQSTLVRVEKVFMSPDNKHLVGTVAAANVSYQKWVVVRFTTDYWKTVSEVTADYNPDVRRKHNDGFDRFNFSIKLNEINNLETKTMFFCVRYNVNGQEHWDSNNAMNFQVEFRKKHLPQGGKNGLQGAKSKSLPHSHPRSAGPRPRSMPPTFDDFGDSFDTKYDFSVFQPSPVSRLQAEPPTTLRLKTKNNPVSSGPTGPSTQATNAFGTRYDFGASLNAAITAANSVLGDRSGIKMKNDKAEPKSVPLDGVPKIPISKSTSWLVGASLTSSPTTLKASDTKRPDLGRPDSYITQKPALQSTSYKELIDKYCFFGSGKNSPVIPGSPANESTLKPAAEEIVREKSPLHGHPFDKSLTASSDGASIASAASTGASTTPPGYPYHHNRPVFAFGESQTVVPLST